MKQQKRVITHSLNYEVLPGETNTLPSETVPDMSMTVQEILYRFSQGRPINFTNNLVYTGDEFTPDTRRMDMVEIDEMVEQNNEYIESLKKDIEDKKAKRKEYRKRLLESKDDSTPAPKGDKGVKGKESGNTGENSEADDAD